MKSNIENSWIYKKKIKDVTKGLSEKVTTTVGYKIGVAPTLETHSRIFLDIYWRMLNIKKQAREKSRLLMVALVII